MKETMLFMSNEQNSLRKKIAHWLHDDFASSKQEIWNNNINNEFITSIQRMMLK